MVLEISGRPGVMKHDPDADLKVDKGCPSIIPISKNARGRLHTEPAPGHPCPCKCEHPRLGEVIESYSLLYKAKWDLGSNEKCDQVKKAMLLDGCYMSIKGTIKLRKWDCPDNDKDALGERDDLHIGCQEGTFVMYRPVVPGDPSSGFVAVFTGELRGIVGMDPAPCPGNNHPRCCQPNHVQGMLNGRGVGLMEDCSLCAAYDGYLNTLEGKDLCGKLDIRWDVTFDGIVCCPCPEKKESREKQEKH